MSPRISLGLHPLIGSRQISGRFLEQFPALDGFDRVRRRLIGFVSPHSREPEWVKGSTSRVGFDNPFKGWVWSPWTIPIQWHHPIPNPFKATWVLRKCSNAWQASLKLRLVKTDCPGRKSHCIENSGALTLETALKTLLKSHRIMLRDRRRVLARRLTGTQINSMKGEKRLPLSLQTDQHQ